jgi:hypothetical protein
VNDSSTSGFSLEDTLLQGCLTFMVFSAAGILRYWFIRPIIAFVAFMGTFLLPPPTAPKKQLKSHRGLRPFLESPSHTLKLFSFSLS